MRDELRAQPKRIPKYLLVQRYASTTMDGQPTWTYLNETFDTLDDALDRMNWRKNGKYVAANTLGEDYFIGLWELRADTAVPVSSEQVVKVERTVREDRSERVVWTAKPAETQDSGLTERGEGE